MSRAHDDAVPDGEPIDTGLTDSNPIDDGRTDGESAEDDLVRRLHQLATDHGAPGATQTAADHLPGLTSGHALYAFGATLSLAIGDLACAVEAAQRRRNR